MAKAINRVTHERIENGVVTSGRVASAEKWADAYRNSLDPWQWDSVVASILMREMEQVFDSCYGKPEMLLQHEVRLSAIKQLLSTMGELAVNPDEMQRILKYELHVRSGKTEEDEMEDDQEDSSS
jgi:hypothetical protein